MKKFFSGAYISNPGITNRDGNNFRLVKWAKKNLNVIAFKLQNINMGVTYVPSLNLKIFGFVY